jgi:hypothetical protein
MPNFSTIRTTVINAYLDNDGGDNDDDDDDNSILINVAIPSDRTVIQKKA